MIEMDDTRGGVTRRTVLKASGAVAGISLAGVSSTPGVATAETETVSPKTMGYWKNHPEAWPVSSLTLGDATYSRGDLVDLLALPTGGDSSVLFAHQWIAARLNVAAGASETEESPTLPGTDLTLAEAEALVVRFADADGRLPFGLTPDGTDETRDTRRLLERIADALENFNEDETDTDDPTPL